MSTTDPDSTYATKGGPERLGYYDNYLVDNASCVIVDVQATPPARLSQESVAARDNRHAYSQQLQFAVRQTNRELQVQRMQRLLIALSLGIIIGLIAASLYWRGTRERSKFLFDQNVKCQQIAKQYQAENRVAVLRVAYSPSRNSCVAEVTRPPQNGGIDFTVDDLLSGELLFVGRCTVGEFVDKSNGKSKTLSKDQDAKFAHVTQ